MNRYRARVNVKRRAQTFDPEGAAVKNALLHLNFSGVERVRVGKTFAITLTAKDNKSARARVTEMCGRLSNIANFITEDFEVVSVRKVR